jgi:hypothetical protein
MRQATADKDAARRPHQMGWPRILLCKYTRPEGGASGSGHTNVFCSEAPTAPDLALSSTDGVGTVAALAVRVAVGVVTVASLAGLAPAAVATGVAVWKKVCDMIMTSWAGRTCMARCASSRNSIDTVPVRAYASAR